MTSLQGFTPGRSLSSRADKDLLGFMFAESQIVTAHSNLDRVTQGGKADQFDGSSNQKTHFHQAWPAFRREFDFGYGCGCAQRDRRQRLKV
jgi:hypothetical protein